MVCGLSKLLFHRTGTCILRLYSADQCRPELDLNFANATQLSSVPSDAYDLRSVTLNPEFASFPGTFGSLLHLAVEDRYGRPLAFSLRYREKSAIKEQVALIRSTRCDNEGALYVTLKPDSLTAEISSPTGKYAVTTVSTLVRNYSSVRLSLPSSPHPPSPRPLSIHHPPTPLSILPDPCSCPLNHQSSK